MKNRIILGIVFLTFFNSSFVVSQNTGSGSKWYKINKGNFITKVHASGDFSELDVVVHMTSLYWNTAEVTYLSEYNYPQAIIKFEWGFIGYGVSRFLAVRAVPVTGSYVSYFSFEDIINPNFDYGLTEIDASLVTPIVTAKPLFIDGNGNVGIGGTDTKGFKLGVHGKIAAEEVKVAIYNNWADFVFNDNYNLPSLAEVEQHIKENGHLKDIPSARDVEENGVLLGDMNAKLLQKIEELTLYTIEQQKEIDELNSLKEENRILNKKFDALESLVSKNDKKQ